MNHRERRAITVGAIAVAVALCLRAVPAAAARVSGWRLDVAARRSLLADTRRIIAEEGVVRDSLARALAALVRLAPVLVPGRSQAEAAASLQSLVSGHAATGRLRVARFDLLDDSSRVAAISRLRVQAEFEGDSRGVVRLIQSIETGTPALRIVRLAVVAPDPMPRQGAPETLRATLEIVGWFFAGETP